MARIRKIVLSVIGIGFLTVMPLVRAESLDADRPFPKGHYEQRGQEMFSQLNLTEDQKQQLEANKKQHRAKMESIREEMKTAKKALQDELMKGELDMARVKAFEEEIKALQSRMEDVKLSSILAVRSILKPEQFLKFITMMHRHREDHKR